MPDTLRILHTNDLHSHFENWPKVSRFLKQKQKKRVNEAVLTVDLGDFLDRWHPLTEATDGQANIELMNTIGYDAVTIGNNEGIGNSRAVLDHLYDDANFPVVLANLVDLNTQTRPEWVKPFLIVPTEIGIKVGIIGLTAPFPLTYNPNNWDVKDPIAILNEVVPDVQKEADYIILLSHLGINSDDQIAAEFPQINLILGSHTHHLFKEGKKINTTQLAAAGKFGYYVGEVTVTFENNQIHKSVAKTFLTESLPEEPKDTAQINSWLEQGTYLLRQVPLAVLPFDLPVVSTTGPSLSEYALNAMALRGNTTISLVNTGLFLDGLLKGMVTTADLHQLLPHPMRLIKVRLNGSDLLRLVGEIERNRLFLKHYPIKGMGFRGKIFGEIIYYGLRYDSDTRRVFVGEELVDPTQDYELTTVDHLMFIPFFPTIELAGITTFLFPEFLRTIVGQGLAQAFPIE